MDITSHRDARTRPENNFVDYLEHVNEERPHSVANCAWVGARFVGQVDHDEAERRSFAWYWPRFEALLRDFFHN